MANKLKLAIIGGGSSYTPELIEGLIKRAEELPIKEVSLVDVEIGREKLEIIHGLSKRMVKKSGVDISIDATLDRRQAIQGADFVVTQFRVGGIDARVRDEKIPLDYGVLGQETTGAGGFAKALRTIPVILDVCKDIKQLAPDAWLINFTNPSGIITETVAKYTDVNAIGLCNVPINMHKSVAQMLGAPMDKVFLRFVGLNHLVWVTNVFMGGKDVTGQLIERFTSQSDSMKNVTGVPWDIDLIESLRMLPCPYHRYYYMTDTMLSETIKSAKEEGTRGEVVRELEKKLFQIYRDPRMNIKPPQLERRGGALYSDAACNLMNSIYNDKRDIQVVNVRNNGTILDLPDDVVIETNCVIAKDGPYPLNIGRVPTRIRGLMQMVKSYEELTIQAGVTGDDKVALQALTIHPLVTSFEIAKNILTDIIRENKEYLPQFKD